MKQKRFTIVGLMGFVLVVALGLGGLKAANPLWASSYYTLAFLSLCAGVLLAIQSRGRRRAFWVGFSFAGWTYFVFSFVLPTTLLHEPPPQFLTATLLEKAEEQLFPDNKMSFSIDYTPSPLPPTPLPPSIPPPPPPSVPPPTTGDGPPPASTEGSPTTITSIDADPTPAILTPPPSPLQPLLFGGGTPVPVSLQPIQPSFRHIGQSMATLILAYIGGLFSLFLAGRREKREAAPTPEVSPSSP